MASFRIVFDGEFKCLYILPPAFTGILGIDYIHPSMHFKEKVEFA